MKPKAFFRKNVIVVDAISNSVRSKRFMKYREI